MSRFNKKTAVMAIGGGILALVILLAGGIFLLGRTKTEVENLMITNVTDTSATVVWTTKEPVGGVVYISKDQKKWSTLSGLGGQAHFDDRDVKTDESGTRKLEKVGKYQTHHITVTGLDPESEYYFTTAESKFAIQKSDAVSNTKIRTASTLEQPVMPNAVYGKVLSEDGGIMDDVIVSIKLLGEDSSPISKVGSTVIAPNGTYTIDIANLRTLDNARVVNDAEIELEEIVIISKDGSNPSQFINKDLDQPVPDIRLTKIEKSETLGLSKTVLKDALADELCGDGKNAECITHGTPGDDGSPTCCEYFCKDSSGSCVPGSVKSHNVGDPKCSAVTLRGASACPGGGTTGGTTGGPSAANGWCTSAMCAIPGVGNCPGRDNGTCGANKICDFGETCGNINCNKCQCGTGWIDPGVSCAQEVSLTKAQGFVMGPVCNAPTPDGENNGFMDTISGVCTHKNYIDSNGNLKAGYTTCKGNDYFKAETTSEGTVHWVYQKSCIRCEDNPNSVHICFGTPEAGGGRATLKKTECSGNILKQTYSIKQADGSDGADETRDTDCSRMVPANICRQKPSADLTDTNLDDHECYLDLSAKYCLNPFDVGCEEGPVYKNLSIGQSYSCVKNDAGTRKVGKFQCDTLGAVPTLVTPPGLEVVNQEGSGYVGVERTVDTTTTIQRIRLGLGVGEGCKREDEVEKVCSTNLPAGINKATAIIEEKDDISTGIKPENGSKTLVCKGLVTVTGESVARDFTWNVQATCTDGTWTFATVAHSGNRDTTKNCLPFQKLAGSYTAKDVECGGDLDSLDGPIPRNGSVKFTDLVDAGCVANSIEVIPVNPSSIVLRCNEDAGCSAGSAISTTVASLSVRKYEDYSAANFGKTGTLTIGGEDIQYYCCCGYDPTCDSATDPSCFMRKEAPDATEADNACTCPSIGLRTSLFSKTHAQGAEQSDGFEGPGVYAVELPGYELTTNSIKVVEVDENGNPVVEFFIDSNKNGIYDEGEEIVTDIPTEELSIKKTETGVDFRINIGWNLLSFPVFAKDEVERTAKGVLKSINDQGVYATQITKYSAGSWITYTYRSDTNEEYGTDFQIIPGEAYFIKSYQRGSFLITGNEYDKSVPVDFVGGWNLVGVISPGSEHTAESVLNSLVSANIQADTVSDYSDGMYQNAIKQDGVLYGYDYPIYSKKGYFIRVEDGSSGKWTP